MKIALLNTYQHGGAGIASRRLQSALKEIGEEADLLHAEQALPRKWPFYLERLSFLPHERDKSVRFSFSLANFGQDISKNPKVQQADVLHLHWINQGFLSLNGIRKLADLGKPIVWTLHDMWAFTGGCHYSGPCTNYLKECGNCPYIKHPHPYDLSHRIWGRKKRAFPENIHFVTCSEWLAKTARSSGLLQNFAVSSIPNPIDTTVFKPIDKQVKLAFRRQYDIPDASFVLLFVAVKVKEERKGFQYLKEALGILKEKYPEIQLDLMVLGTANPEDLAALPYPCHPLGMVKDINLLTTAYAASDVFVIPSLEDNLPNTVMESIACGTPVVGFETGGIPEMVDHLQNGFIAPQRDSEALAAGIHWVFQEHASSNTERLPEAARTKAVQQYANAIVARRYLKLYNSLV